MNKRFQFALVALLVVMFFVTATFAAMAFAFYREVIELQEHVRVEQKNSANRETQYRELAEKLIKAQKRIDDLEGR